MKLNICVYIATFVLNDIVKDKSNYKLKLNKKKILYLSFQNYQFNSFAHVPIADLSFKREYINSRYILHKLRAESLSFVDSVKTCLVLAFVTFFLK